jgi:hypothetical protein
MSLGATTWGIYWKVRPSALTATILSCSITTNLTAGFLISLGGRRTRKKEEVEKRLRQALTAEAMRHLEQQKRDEARAARGEPAGHGLQASISRHVDKVKGQDKDQQGRRGSEETDERPLTREESGENANGKKARKGGDSPSSDLAVPEREMIAQMP